MEEITPVVVEIAKELELKVELEDVTLIMKTYRSEAELHLARVLLYLPQRPSLSSVMTLCSAPTLQ